MTSELFNYWLSSWNEKLRHKTEKFYSSLTTVLLIIWSTDIAVHFLSLNTTSVLQPMDKGVINSFNSPMSESW